MQQAGDHMGFIGSVLQILLLQGLLRQRAEREALALCRKSELPKADCTFNVEHIFRSLESKKITDLLDVIPSTGDCPIAPKGVEVSLLLLRELLMHPQATNFPYGHEQHTMVPVADPDILGRSLRLLGHNTPFVGTSPL